MTYELPDEVWDECVEAIAMTDDGGVLGTINALTPVLAAHFERVGAEKMREAAAAEVDELDAWTDEKATLRTAAAIIRLLRLPQLTPNTEEATNG